MFEKKTIKPIIEKEKWRIVEELSKRFIQRWDIHARQLDDGKYICVRKAFSFELMYLHLRGKITLGVYLLDKESRARFTVLDADIDSDLRKLQIAAQDLERLKIPSYLESSRRGGHLWLFFGKPIPGEKARNFGLGIAKAYELGEIEVFPKQGLLSSGPGSLIRMPFGIHRKSSARYSFITPAGQLMGTYRSQLEILCRPLTVANETVDMFQYRKPESRHFLSGSHERFRQVPLIDFLSRYVKLSPISSGAIGLCPFHDDQQPSFGVNAIGNYWNCFAGCGGGDIVSFWMKFKNLDYLNALKELEELLYGHTTG